MASTVWEDLRNTLSMEIGRIELNLGKGVAKDYPAYREDVGRIRGLRSAACFSVARLVSDVVAATVW